MGRIMLNVLLSFAQFEREVTGERIRDKIAASKAKGMWNGSLPPLGYHIPAPGSRTLRLNETEAATVRDIFARYLELGSVHVLQRELTAQGILSKRRITAAGKVTGGKPFSRGALFHLLRNRIDEELFARAHAMVNANARRHRTAAEHRIVRAPLTGQAVRSQWRADESDILARAVGSIDITSRPRCSNAAPAVMGAASGGFRRPRSNAC
jgi:hypothetical protein